MVIYYTDEVKISEDLFVVLKTYWGLRTDHIYEVFHFSSN